MISVLANSSHWLVTVYPESDDKEKHQLLHLVLLSSRPPRPPSLVGLLVLIVLCVVLPLSLPLLVQIHLRLAPTLRQLLGNDGSVLDEMI